MKVLMINGSPRVNGNTSIALKEMEQIFRHLRRVEQILHHHRYAGGFQPVLEQRTRTGRR